MDGGAACSAAISALGGCISHLRSIMLDRYANTAALHTASHLCTAACFCCISRDRLAWGSCTHSSTACATLHASVGWGFGSGQCCMLHQYCVPACRHQQDLCAVLQSIVSVPSGQSSGMRISCSLFRLYSMCRRGITLCASSAVFCVLQVCSAGSPAGAAACM